MAEPEKFTLLVNVPLGKVTLTGPVTAPAGTVAKMKVSEVGGNRTQGPSRIVLC
jgi:hypothetical protein